MINRSFKKFIKILKSTKLSEKEKSLLRYRVSEFMAFNPIRTDIKVAKKSFYFSVFTLRTLSKTLVIALILTIVVGGSGVTYASNSALPGDKLYQVKVNVNEKIEEKLALSSNAKIQVQSAHVERRLNEAITLVQNQNFSPEKKEIVKTNLERNVKSVTQSIESLKEEGKIERALEITSNISPILETHREILTRKTEQKDTDTQVSQNTEIESEISTSSVDGLIETIETAIKQIEDIEETVIERILDNQESLENLTSRNKEEVNQIINSIRASENHDTSVPRSSSASEQTTELPEGEESEANMSVEIASESNESDANTLRITSATVLITEAPIIKSEEDVEARIKRAEDLLIQAEVERENKNYREALVLSQRAKKIIRQIEIYKKIRIVDAANMPTENKEEVKKSNEIQNDSTEIKEGDAPNQETEITEEQTNGVEIEGENETSVEITEIDVIKSIEESNGLLQKINQTTSLEAQIRL